MRSSCQVLIFINLEKALKGDTTQHPSLLQSPCASLRQKAQPHSYPSLHIHSPDAFLRCHYSWGCVGLLTSLPYVYLILQMATSSIVQQTMLFYALATKMASCQPSTLREQRHIPQVRTLGSVLQVLQQCSVHDTSYRVKLRIKKCGTCLEVNCVCMHNLLYVSTCRETASSVRLLALTTRAAWIHYCIKFCSCTVYILL